MNPVEVRGHHSEVNNGRNTVSLEQPGKKVLLFADLCKNENAA